MRNISSPVAKVFLVALTMTLVIWILRGVGLLTFMPGFVLWLLILVTIASGILSGIQRTR